MSASVLPIEEWRRIDGFPNYKVSNLGRVYSAFRGGRILVPQFTKKRYLKVHLHYDGKDKNPFVHKLVALAFIGKRESDAMQINHKNGIKSDNRAVNLEWCTASENTLHAYRVLKRRAPQQGRPLTEDVKRRISESNKRTKALKRKEGKHEGA